MQSNLPSVSYILCVFNGEKTLVSCLESLLTQKGVSLQIIAVNDGSSDHSLSILQNYASQYKQIKIINQKNFGLATARNVGISHAKGDYIASAAQDDVYLPHKSINQIKFMEEKNLDFSFAYVDLIDEFGLPLKHKDTALYNCQLWRWPWVIFQVAFFMPLCSPTFICKRQCYEAIHWNSSLLIFADYNLWLKMFLQFKGGKLEKISLLHRCVDRLKNQEYREKFPLSFLYLEHRIAAASAFIYKFIPHNFILPISNFFKLLKNVVILEKRSDRKAILKLSQIYSQAGYSYISQKLKDIATSVNFR